VGERALTSAFPLDLEADAHSFVPIVPFVGHLGPIKVVDPSSFLVEKVVVSFSFGD
jgi:hypothetical protein